MTSFFHIGGIPCSEIAYSSYNSFVADLLSEDTLSKSQLLAREGIENASLILEEGSVAGEGEELRARALVGPESEPRTLSSELGAPIEYVFSARRVF